MHRSINATQRASRMETARSPQLAQASEENGNNRFRRMPHSGGERHNRNGGKFEGLKLLHTLIASGEIKCSGFDGTKVEFTVPATWELPNGYHLDLMRHNKGRLITAGDDFSRIQKSFSNAEIPESVERALRAIVVSAKSNVLVVRSDSFCEDGIHPFAGEFTSEFVVLKGSEDRKVEQLARALKIVSASLYEPIVQKRIRQYGLSSSEQWMSFVVQEVHGKEHAMTVDGQERRLFFPDSALVVTSKCLRPWDAGIKRTDAIARIAAGLGTMAVNQEKPCRTLSLKLPGMPGPGEVYGLSDMEKGDTAELDEYANRSQRSFQAIDLVSGKLVEIQFDSVPQAQLCAAFPGAISAYSAERGRIVHGFSGYGKGYGILRATFMGDAETEREFYSVILLNLIQQLKEKTGFEVDMEIAVNRCEKGINVALVQLRPFGTNVADTQVALSKVRPERLIAKAFNCIGHGVFEFDMVGVLLAKEQGSREVLGNLNDRHPMNYVLIGPGADAYLGSGGPYQGCIAPGAVVSTRESGQVMMDYGTHTFMNVAMRVVLPVMDGKLNLDALKGEVKNGVLVSSGKKVRIEVNGETGEGQIFVVD